MFFINTQFAELLRLEGHANTGSVHRNMHRVAKRMEQELDTEHSMFIEWAPWDCEWLLRLPVSLTIGLDRSYVHECDVPSLRESWFGVIAG